MSCQQRGRWRHLQVGHRAAGGRTTEDETTSGRPGEDGWRIHNNLIPFFVSKIGLAWQLRTLTRMNRSMQKSRVNGNSCNFVCLWKWDLLHYFCCFANINLVAVSEHVFNTPGGLKMSELISNHLIDHFVPFLPLEREHVRKSVFVVIVIVVLFLLLLFLYFKKQCNLYIAAASRTTCGTATRPQRATRHCWTTSWASCSSIRPPTPPSPPRVRNRSGSSRRRGLQSKNDFFFNLSYFFLLSSSRFRNLCLYPSIFGILNLCL